MWPQLQIFCLLFKSSVLQPRSIEEKSRYGRGALTLIWSKRVCTATGHGFQTGGLESWTGDTISLYYVVS